MSTAGSVLFMLLLGWVIAWTFSWLFPYSTFNWALTFIGIALFIGLTAYDTQRLKKIGSQLNDHPAAGGLAVLGALSLYLDFINIFLIDAACSQGVDTRRWSSHFTWSACQMIFCDLSTREI